MSVNGRAYTSTFNVATRTMTRRTPAGRQTTSVVDDQFRVLQAQVPGLTAVDFGYDADGLLTAAGSLTLARDPSNGLLTGTSLSSSGTTQSYNSFGEVSHFTANQGASAVLDIVYQRDDLGRIIQKTETIGGLTDTYAYGYDGAGRLTLVGRNGVTTASYAYDANGNRLSRTTPGGTETGTYDAQDRLLTYGTKTYTYTANGELLTKTDTTTSQTTQYTYDALGNLNRAVLPDGRQIDYLVDGRNRRVAKKVNGAFTQKFLYGDQLRIAVELSASNAVVSRFVYATRVNVPDYVVKGSSTYRIVTDHLGSPRLVINVSTGALAQRMDYDEFGRVLLDTNPGFQPFGFAGGLYDPDTGLVRFGARDYDAEVGRWTRKDPILFNGGQASLYTYVSSDPINDTDTTGYILETAWDLFNVGLDLRSLSRNLKCGQYGDAVLDALGLVLDSGAVILPFVPAGVGMILKVERTLPKAARTTREVSEVFRRLERFHGIDPVTASERLHDIKRGSGLRPDENVMFDLTGGVFNPETRELLGTLTEGGARKRR